MSETKTPRAPAGERGTDHRIDTGHGHYWVRLITRGAIKREGECMVNCCRHGTYSDDAGPEGLDETALWSLRRETDAVSIALARVDCDGDLIQFKGPMNNQASGLAYRSLRQLREYLVAGDALLKFPYHSVIVDDEGNTYRPDKAPRHIREAAEAKEAAERKEADERWLRQRAERHAQLTEEQTRAWIQPGQLMFRPEGQSWFVPAGQVTPDETEADVALPHYVQQQGVRRTVALQTRFEVRGADVIARAFREMREHALAAIIRGEPHRPAALPSNPEPPRPAFPDLSALPTPQARMRAVRENRQARLADRRWVRDNERAQRRLAR